MIQPYYEPKEPLLMLISSKHYNSKTNIFRIRIINTFLINSYQNWYWDQPCEWVINGVMTPEEMKHLESGVGTSTYLSYHIYSFN